MRIMFVCTGNTCRSAMAEAIFKRMVEDEIQVELTNVSYNNEFTFEIYKAVGFNIVPRSLFTV